MSLYDRLVKRKTAGQLDLPATMQPRKQPAPTSSPSPTAVRPPTAVSPIAERLSQAPTGAGSQGRMLADLPVNTQINAISKILAGENAPNEFVNNFVRRAGAKGMTPEQIRQAFISEQRTSSSPLMLA